jgi:hypothetical protein
MRLTTTDWELLVMFFLLYCAYHTDYHWDCHLFFVIIPFHAQTLLITAYLFDSGCDSFLLLILVAFIL